MYKRLTERRCDILIKHFTKNQKICADLLKRSDLKIFFVGIGGVSMSALAHWARERGYKVAGSDIEEGQRTEELKRRGVQIYIGHSEANIIGRGIDLGVCSLSLDEDNKEIRAMRALGIPIVSRAVFMGELMRGYRHRIGVSASHGKSTVTAMLAKIFSDARLLPTVLSGADLTSFGSYLSGERDYLIYEACEYGDSFLHFNPTTAVMMNLELDHTDYFPDIESIKKSFFSAAERAEERVFVSFDDNNLSSLLNIKGREIITVGEREGANYRYAILASDKGRYAFRLYFNEKHVGDFSLSIPGKFNVKNSAFAVAVAHGYGIAYEHIRKSLASFSGIGRRMERLCEIAGTDIFYDYAHHPTEISAGISALREMGYGRVGVAFRPHTYSRTEAFQSSFAGALKSADISVVTDIYGAREAPRDNVTAENLAQTVRFSGGDCIYLPEEKIIDYLMEKKLGAIAVMGAGDVNLLLRKIKEASEKKC